MVLLSLIGPLFLAQVPDFHEPVIIQADGVDIDVGYVADPFTVDWDGDGVLDLLVGQFTSGKINFFRNTGTNQEPVYTFDSFIQADGSDLILSYG